MGKNVKVDIKELREFQRQVDQLQDSYDTFIEGLAKEIAARLLRKVKQRTPVGDTRTLRDSWKTANTNIKIRKLVGMYEIEVINPTYYADYVESGHRTRNHKSFVPGKFFLKVSEEEIQAIAPTLVERRIEQKIREMMK